MYDAPCREHPDCVPRKEAFFPPCTYTHTQIQFHGGEDGGGGGGGAGGEAAAAAAGEASSSSSSKKNDTTFLEDVKNTAKAAGVRRECCFFQFLPSFLACFCPPCT